jgi:DNA-binding IclR family transcriptional regulator
MPELNSTEKVLKILGAFLPRNQPRGNLELSRMLDIHRASVNRILGILKQNGFVEQDQKTKLYKLGPVFTEYGQAVLKSSLFQLKDIAEPHLRRLSQIVQESVGLGILVDNNVRVPFQIRGPQAVSVAFVHGEQGAINANSGAKAILAYLPEQQLERIIGFHQKLPSFTPNTLTHWDQVVSQFKKIRRTGFAYDIEEYNLDVQSVGAPIFNPENEPICAVTILVPSLRKSAIFDPKLLSSLKETADAISSEINHSIELI